MLDYMQPVHSSRPAKDVCACPSVHTVPVGTEVQVGVAWKHNNLNNLAFKSVQVTANFLARAKMDLIF